MEIRDSEMSLVFFILYICKMKKLIGKIGVCCYSGLAERNAEYHVNSIFYRS